MELSNSIAKDILESAQILTDSHLKPKGPVPSDGIVLGLSWDVVLWEVTELLRLRLAGVFKIPETAVECSIHLEQGKIIPEIQVDGDAAEGLEPDEIREVIRSVWLGVPPVRPGVKDELEERLTDLRSERAKA